MKHFSRLSISAFSFILYLTLSFFGNRIYAQVINPSDIGAIYNPANPPSFPAANTMAKWVYTSGGEGFDVTPFKPYIYNNNSFRLLFPPSYQPLVQDGKLFPLIINFSGAGLTASVYNNDNIINNPGGLGAKYVQEMQAGNINGFVLFPNFSFANTPGTLAQYNSLDFQNIYAIVQYMIANCKVDPQRIILTGCSEGALATWNMLEAYPQLAAAALPISFANFDYNQGIPNYKFTPIWLSQGGQDPLASPTIATNLVNNILAAGGNITYSFYPNDGHDTWDDQWAKPDFWSFMMNANKANPWPLHGRTTFCSSTTVLDTLGLTPGFKSYRWYLNGTLIPGANSNTYVATQLGTYSAQYQNSDNTWSTISPNPVSLILFNTIQAPNIILAKNESSLIPALDTSKGVYLTVPGTFTSYSWTQQGSTTVLGTGSVFLAKTPGNYQCTVTLQYGCNSLASAPFTVVSANGSQAPLAASNLTAIATGPASIQLNWVKNKLETYNNTGFEVYRALQSAGPYTFVSLTPSDTVRFLDKNLNPGTLYYYQIRSVNGQGAAPSSNIALAKTKSDTIPPSIPQNLSGTLAGQGKAILSWNASSDNSAVAGYNIYVNGAKFLYTTNTSDSLFNLTGGPNYTFAVQAVDLAGNVSPISTSITKFDALVADGSFEYPALSSLNKNYLYNITGAGSWTFTGGSGIESNGGPWTGTNAPDGTQAAFIQLNGKISTPVNIPNSGNYVLKFYVVSREPAGATNQSIQISFDDTVIGTYTPKNNGYFMKIITSAFSAISGSHTLSFQGLTSSGDYSDIIDSIGIYPANYTGLTDNGFENPAYASATYHYNPTGVGNWSFSGFTGIENNGSAFGAPKAIEGNQAAFIQYTGSISSSIYVSQAGSYNLHFYAAGRPGMTSPSQSLNVLVDNQVVGNYNPQNTTNFIRISTGNFTLSPGNHTLSFAGTANIDADYFVDSVGISLVSPQAILGNSFESPKLSAGGYQYNPSGVGLWTFTGSSGIEANSGPWTGTNAPDGTQAAFIQLNGKISTPINVATKGNYSVSFYVVSREPSGSINQSIQVLWDNSVIGTYSPKNNGYFVKINTNPFSTTAGTHTLTFQGLTSSGDYSDIIDSIGFNSSSIQPINDLGFEMPKLTPGTFQYYPNGITNWTFNSYAGIESNGSGFGATNAPEGTQAAFIQYTGNISTKINLSTAGNYNVHFFVAGRNGYSSPNQSLNVLVDNQVIGNYNPQNINSFIKITTNNILLSAGSHTLSFAATANIDADYFIDSVGISLANNPILSNNGFENPKLSAGSYQYNPVGVPGWTFNSQTGIQSNGSGWGAPKAPEGSQTAFIQGVGNMSTSINIASAGYYVVSFLTAGRNGYSSPTANSFNVSWDNTNIGNYNPQNTNSFTKIITQSTYLGAGSHTLSFTGTSNVDIDYFIDSVSVMVSPIANPVLVQSPVLPIKLAPGTPVSNSLQVTDANTGAILNWSFDFLPGFISTSSNGNTLNFQYNPQTSDIGNYTVHITVTDQFGGSLVIPLLVNVVGNQTNITYINFGDNAHLVSKPWNNTGYNLNAGYSQTLYDQNGAVSGIMSFLKSWSGTQNVGVVTGNNSGIYKDSVLQSSFTYTGSDTISVQFSGLNKNNSYSYSFLSSWANPWAADTTFFIIGNNKVSQLASNNSSKVVSINGISPDANGNIVVKFIKGSTSPAVILSAMVITSSSNGSGSPISAPALLKAHGLSTSTIGLSWQASPGAMEYYIYRSCQAAGPYSLIDSTLGSITTYLDKNLNTNTSYFYQLKAKNTSTVSVLSEMAYATTLQYVVDIQMDQYLPAGFPWNSVQALPNTGLSLNNLINTQGTTTGINMNFIRGFSGANSVGVNTGNNSGIFPDNVLQPVFYVEAADSAIIQLTGLSLNSSYDFIFFNSWLNPTSFNPSFTNPFSTFSIGGQTVNLDPTNNTSRTVQINNVLTDQNGNVYIHVKAGAGSPYGILNALVIQAHQIPANTGSAYISLARNAVESFVPVSPKIQDLGLVAFPVPMKENVTVRFNSPTTGNYSLNVFTSTGKKVYSESNLSLNQGINEKFIGSAISELPGGVYFIQISSDKFELQTIKVIK